MSMLDSYFKGWKFRTTNPSLEPGNEINIFVNEYNGNNTGIANVGDTRLYIEGVGPEHVEKRVNVEVTEFDKEKSVGRGTFREVVGDSSYTA
ncbi:TRAM domain-containing protein [Natronococcus pandeyae]|uniref:TRAM domain-containing protein n=1 Tax=Natronococcus pandeyae TaxID=2055836 RepID=A0A8J8TQC0_9EURY|nr:TRAM domain-containing protein [Natronococcus pandeyae]TYL36730.1 TRAM domain-containing protein [Natronococcus pandeyae]